MDKLGDFLVTKSVISKDDLVSATNLQEETSSSLAQIILTQGYINPYKLYEAIADFHQLEFADLMRFPCDETLVNEHNRQQYSSLKALPWKLDNGTIVIATGAVTNEVKNWAAKTFGNFRLAITSPFDIHMSLNSLFETANNNDALERLAIAQPQYSAKDLFAGMHSKIFIVALLLLIPVFILFPQNSIALAFFIISAFYTATLFFKTMLFLIGMLRRANTANDNNILQISDKDLPIYTILVPLYKEDRVLNKLTAAIRGLDYPKSKLDVKLIVEADDDITIAAIKALKCERMFEMIKVPYSLPRTKPKACNYALQFAKGEFVTIYDAEDRPDPMQLKKALYAFYNSPPELACVQARLNYFNRNENWLSRLFAIEYSTLFDFMLPGLEAMEIPIPLGGTSNHFRTQTLNDLYAWDPYNVTEDADLGIRIAQKGWRCQMIDSVTMEECPLTIRAWIKQRSRWIKGHMQTYFVHMRQPLQLYKKLGMTGFMGMQFFLGAPALIFLISPIMWTLWACFMLGVFEIPHHMPTWFQTTVNFSTEILVAGIFLQMLCAIIAVRINKWEGMLPSVLVFPFYWFLHSVASFKALWQLITKPYYWEKTTHGLSLINDPR